MKTRRRFLLWFVLTILPLLAADRMWQYRLNRQLIDALLHDNTKQALTLVNAGADPNTHLNALPVYDSATAFLLACGVDCELGEDDCPGPPIDSTRLALVQAMFLHGANLDAQTQYKGSALYGAATANQPSVVEWLLEHHANVNAQDNWGRTPLHQAVLYDHPNVAHLLLAHGADVHVQTKEGETALHYAVSGFIDKDIIRRLLAHGADPNLRNKYGVTPLQSAQGLGSPDIVALMKRGRK